VLGVEEQQPQGLLQGKTPEFTSSRLSDDQIAALDGPAEDRSRMPLRGHVPPAWGQTACLAYALGAVDADHDPGDTDIDSLYPPRRWHRPSH
jgi:hypothetical protein